MKIKDSYLSLPTIAEIKKTKRVEWKYLVRIKEYSRHEINDIQQSLYRETYKD